MKNLFFYSLLLSLLFSCSDKELMMDDDGTVVDETIDESTFVFQDGFVERKLNTQIRTIIPTDKSILLKESTDEEEQLVKYSLLTNSIEWQAEKWYEEMSGRGNYYYLYEDLILFRQGHHDFALNLSNGQLEYDVERDGCPDSRIVGIGYDYFTRREVIDESTQLTKEIILVGDIRESFMPEILGSPLYDSIGNASSLGRIMNMDAFENTSGEKMLAIRYFDYEPGSGASSLKDLYAVYNISESNWTIRGVPLDYHVTGIYTILTDQYIYLGSQDYLSCLDIETGEMMWGDEAAGIGSSSFAFGDGDIFIRGGKGMVQRRSGETGDLIWESYLKNASRFIIIKDKLFSVGNDLNIFDIETGENIYSYSSPYVDYNPGNYFSNTSNLMGYYDEESQRFHVFFNIDDHMVYYQLEE